MSVPRHPDLDFWQAPLGQKDQLRGERMCAAAGSFCKPTSVLRPWRRRSGKRFEPPQSPSREDSLTKRSEMMQLTSAEAQSCSASIEGENYGGKRVQRHRDHWDQPRILG